MKPFWHKEYKSTILFNTVKEIWGKRPNDMLKTWSLNLRTWTWLDCLDSGLHSRLACKDLRLNVTCKAMTWSHLCNLLCTKGIRLLACIEKWPPMHFKAKINSILHTLFVINKQCTRMLNWAFENPYWLHMQIIY